MIFPKLNRGIESFIWCKRPTGKTAFRRHDATRRFTVPFTQQAGQNASSLLSLSLSLLGDRVHLHDLLDRRNVDNMKAQNDRPRLRPPLHATINGQERCLKRPHYIYKYVLLQADDINSGGGLKILFSRYTVLLEGKRESRVNSALSICPCPGQYILIQMQINYTRCPNLVWPRKCCVDQ